MSSVRLKVKSGDSVLVIAGKDKGKKGKVTRVIPAANRVVVEGVNRVKRHTKPNQKVMQGGITEKDAPIHVSNVMVICQNCGRPARIGHKLLEDGSKVRMCRKCKEVIDR